VRIGAVIVSHQSAGFLRACLEACLRHVPLDDGLVVVDNASTDGSACVASSVPGVTVFPNTNNAGFAGGVNQGFRAMPSADLVLLLNPDAILKTGIESLTRCFDDPRLAIASGALCDEDGTPQRGFTIRRLPTATALTLENLAINRIWPGNSCNRSWRCFDLDLSRAQDVEQPAGAFLLIRRSVWETLGGFDEGFYPAWFEDVDFCRRVRQSGYRIRYEPMALAVHAGGHSVRSIDWCKRQVYWNENLLRYSGLHFSRPGQLATALSAAVGGVARGMWEAVQQSSPSPLRAAGAIVRTAAAASWRAVGVSRQNQMRGAREGNSERG
jgi:GT2 family glycosyltransferase